MKRILARAKTDIPGAIWLLGAVSLCMDLSSEMIHALLPVFLVSVLGAGTVALGLIEGIAEGIASLTRVFSGAMSDRLGRRKPLAVLGYGLAALTKPLFPLAASTAWVLVARCVDRLGKGIRGAPRDALVADLAPPEVRGAAYGLRQSLDTAGAVLGPLTAIALMEMFAGDVRAVFWIAVVPALAAVALLALGVKEPQRRAEAGPQRATVRWQDFFRLGKAFWAVMAIGILLTLARFSEAFLVLRAHDAGLSFTWTPLALVVMNVVYFVSAYPAGRLSDRVGRMGLAIVGLTVLVVAEVFLALAGGPVVVLFGIAIWGLHMGLTQGLLTAMVADSVLSEKRGTAFGVFHFVAGLAALAASVGAGTLWAWYGPTLAFMAGAVFSAVALAGILWHRIVRT